MGSGTTSVNRYGLIGRRCLATAMISSLILACVGVPGGNRAPAAEIQHGPTAGATSAGIRKLSGRHLILFTDLGKNPEIDSLPVAFDQAFPEWCEYFGINPADHDDWRMTGFLMEDADRFRQSGQLPSDLPSFGHGYSRNHELWLYEQPSDYYRRHLLLHEGTHGFMNTLLGGCGPPWYMEGMAELLATHRWSQGRLELNYMPATREEVPMWGRIKMIRDDFAARRAKRFTDVLLYGPQAHLKREPYAWCWAAAALLDGHPLYQERFRKIPQFVLKPDFADRFQRLIGDDWDELCEQWQVFVADLEYGYDVPKTVVDFAAGSPVGSAGASVRVAADRGWQNSGLQLESGQTYSLRAEGRYQVANEPQTWWCEPGGVSIRYYNGRPLGILLAAVRPDPTSGGVLCPLIRPVTVGLGTTLRPPQSGTLFLRINDSGGELDDNAGELVVGVEVSSAVD